MPAIPWTKVSDVPEDAPVLVMASRLPLRSHLRIPGFLRWTLWIRRQLATAPGLVGYALDAHPVGKTFWTVSAWTDRAALDQFVGAEPHRSAMAAIRPHMLASAFRFWEAEGRDLPVPWKEVRRRIAEKTDDGALKLSRPVADDPQ